MSVDEFIIQCRSLGLRLLVSCGRAICSQLAQICPDRYLVLTFAATSMVSAPRFVRFVCETLMSGITYQVFDTGRFSGLPYIVSKVVNNHGMLVRQVGLSLPYRR
jgi:hypothetical protein